MKETHSSVSSVDTLDFRYEISAQYPSDTLLKYPSEAQYFQQYRAANKVGCGSVRRGAIIHPSLVLELAGRRYCRNLGIDVYIRRNFWESAKSFSFTFTSSAVSNKMEFESAFEHAFERLIISEARVVQ